MPGALVPRAGLGLFGFCLTPFHGGLLSGRPLLRRSVGAQNESPHVCSGDGPAEPRPGRRKGSITRPIAGAWRRASGGYSNVTGLCMRYAPPIAARAASSSLGSTSM